MFWLDEDLRFEEGEGGMEGGCKVNQIFNVTHIALVWVGGSDFKKALTLLSWQAISHQLGFGGGAEAKKARKWYALSTISEMVCFHCYIQGR